VVPLSIATRQECRLRKLMLLFLIIKTNFGSQNKSHRSQKMLLRSGLERLDDISAVCSHCGLMVQHHVTCMSVVVELWTEY
jgi:hypothetical protein